MGQAQSTTNNQTKGQSSSKEGDMLYGGTGNKSSIYKLLPENQMMNSNKYRSQLDQMKAALDEKSPELTPRKYIIFYQDKARLYVSLLLLLSCLSHVRLCATPQTAAHQAPLSLGFSRQEHWSGLPFPSPMHESEKWKWSRSVMSDSSWPHGLQPTRLLRPWDFPGKSTGVGCHCLLQYVSLMTRQKLSHLGWEVLNHPPYSPGIAPLDFHLFLSLQNSSMEKISIPWKTVNGTWNSSFLKKIKCFGKMKLWSCLKNGRR